MVLKAVVVCQNQCSVWSHLNTNRLSMKLKTFIIILTQVARLFFCLIFRLWLSIHSGLVTIAQWLGLSIMAPNKKISILLIGNHSAGKSSLVNWYIEDNVQRTGVAIETQGKLIWLKSMSSILNQNLQVCQLLQVVNDENHLW